GRRREARAGQRESRAGQGAQTARPELLGLRHADPSKRPPTSRIEPMTEQRRTALKELQKLDIRIQEARQRIQDFDPRFEEVEEPVLVLESELGTTRKRVQEMKLDERRLELSVQEKRERLKKL